MTYSEKLKDPRWQKRRLKILERDRWECQICGENESTLHVHHRRYIGVRDPWDYPECSLVTLCEICHKSEQDCIKDSCDNLVAQVRDKFYAYGIDKLATCFNNIDIIHCESYTADMICWALSNDKPLEVIFNMFNGRNK